MEWELEWDGEFCYHSRHAIVAKRDKRKSIGGYLGGQQ